MEALGALSVAAGVLQFLDAIIRSSRQLHDFFDAIQSFEPDFRRHVLGLDIRERSQETQGSSQVKLAMSTKRKVEQEIQKLECRKTGLMLLVQALELAKEAIMGKIDDLSSRLASFMKPARARDAQIRTKDASNSQSRSLSLKYSSQRDWQGYSALLPSLAMHPILTDHDAIWEMIASDDLEGVIDLFRQRKNGPFDQNDNGKSLLMLPNYKAFDRYFIRFL
ncbi:hypothetical protein QBC34DRAFT_427816 [Podospora aff. communis PSN243]|uniref:Fungal N-terminal domain-containing protein n=1 Tax=Podospora aff. communis PSN243 TaxID=3040156 RepID=A0AAV9GEA5_9PEZI|nr:hypothetical protein QBC34DRAFT_427816 [Podospora aff. communis PSN243]